MASISDVKQQITDTIKRINDKNPYYLIIGIIFVILIADYLLIMQFQLKALQSLNPKIATLKETYLSTQNNIGRVPQYRKEARKLNAEIQGFRRRTRSKQEIPLILEDISQVADRYGIRIQQISPDRTPEEPLLKTKTGTYFAVPILLEVQGGYHQFAAFLNQLESKEMLMTVPDFTIAARSDDPLTHDIRLTINAIVFEHH